MAIPPFAVRQSERRRPRSRSAPRDRPARLPAELESALTIYEPRTNIFPAGGGIGRGLPMAIGAQLAQPHPSDISRLGRMNG